MHKLERYLTEKNLTQAEFGARVGVSQETISRYINGERYPRPDVLISMERETGGAVTANDFLPRAELVTGGHAPTGKWPLRR